MALSRPPKSPPKPVQKAPQNPSKTPSGPQKRSAYRGVWHPKTPKKPGLSPYTHGVRKPPKSGFSDPSDHRIAQNPSPVLSMRKWPNPVSGSGHHLPKTPKMAKKCHFGPFWAILGQIGHFELLWAPFGQYESISPYPQGMSRASPSSPEPPNHRISPKIRGNPVKSSEIQCQTGPGGAQMSSLRLP